MFANCGNTRIHDIAQRGEGAKGGGVERECSQRGGSRHVHSNMNLQPALCAACLHSWLNLLHAGPVQLCVTSSSKTPSRASSSDPDGRVFQEGGMTLTCIAPLPLYTAYDGYAFWGRGPSPSGCPPEADAAGVCCACARVDGQGWVLGGGGWKRCATQACAC